MKKNKKLALNKNTIQHLIGGDVILGPTTIHVPSVPPSVISSPCVCPEVLDNP